MSEMELYKGQVKARIRQLINNGQLAEAGQLVAEYEKLVPLDPEIYSLRALMYMREKKYDMAEYIMKQGLKIDSAKFELLYSLAGFMEKAGNLHKAKEYYEDCLVSAADEELRRKLFSKIDALGERLDSICRLDFRKRVLIGSPIRQKPEILREFLTSLSQLNKDMLDVAWFFVDDNDNSASSKLLEQFREVTPKVTVHRHQSSAPYISNDTTHNWNDKLISKVAELKNLIIRAALQNEADYLFLVDSDLVLHPNTLEHLISRGKDIISQVFWTSWQPDSPAVPQVWLYDQYTQCHVDRGRNMAQEELVAGTQKFIEMLKQPGTYEVGGLGACTVISKKALLAGVNFSEVKNISFWGEDRHFCIRAAVLGFALYADTHYLAYHIYREADLAGVATFKERCGQNAPEKPAVLARPTKQPSGRLTLSMVIKNEAGRYLKAALEEHRQYIDSAVIIDDGSTDDSVAVCERVLAGIPLRIVKNGHSLFHNEVELRKLQWNETIKTNPEWILNLDADEIFEKKFKTAIRQMLVSPDLYAYCFRLYDFWDERHFREDKYWCAHLTYRPFMVRYMRDFAYQWNEQPQHCGRFPNNILNLPWEASPLRLKHMGWAKAAYRLEKYRRYQRLDPGAVYGIKEQYESILDETPNLIAWNE